MDHRSDPLMRDARFVRPLHGFSGARVYLMSYDERTWFVRKVAADTDASARLRGQARKQAQLPMVLSMLKTPEILAEGEVDGRYYFDMQFVRGTDGIDFLRRASYDEVAGFADKLCAYTEAAAALPPAITPPRSMGFFDAMYDKILNVQRCTRALEDRTLTALFLALAPLKALGPEAHTLCHGDMTLENLLVDDHGQIWCLDLLDSPFEHYWQDVAKLNQDVWGGWYQRRMPALSVCVSRYVARRLREQAEQLDPRYAAVQAILVATTFVRILPYVKTEAQASFVRERVDYFARRAVALGGYSN